ncbi:MAG: hypothetical protein V2A67_00660 [Bacteroidota bacterium]
MNKFSFLFPVLACGMLLQFPGGAIAQSAGDAFIFHDPSRKILVAEATQNGGRKLTGRVLKSTDSLAMLALDDLGMPFNNQMIRISQCARNLVGNSAGPNLLFLSKNEGGFPRTGIWLTEADGKEMHYPDLQFVDLVLDKDRIERGDLSIYSHELGHVMMGLILDETLEKLDLGRSKKQHVSMGVTDYITAFSEGWGVHFQRLAYDQTAKYRQAFDDKLTPDRSLSLVWHSGMDEYLRLQFVRDNGYIYEKFIQLGVDHDTLSQEQKILLEHTSPAFDHTRIKNAQQMLSCEGVLATLFYQINSDKKLAGNYLPSEFYAPFLVQPLPADLTPEQVFTPLENMMLKNLWVWKRMTQSGFQGNPFIAWLDEWCRQFPEDREEILKLFIQITKGVTISPDLARLSETISYVGQVGDYQSFKGLLPGYQEMLKNLIQQILTDPVKLTANIGPELWVTSKKVMVRRGLWMPEPKSPLSVNMNSAGLSEIEIFTGKEKAFEFIQKRKELGYFTSIEQIRELGFEIVR